MTRPENSTYYSASSSGSGAISVTRKNFGAQWNHIKPKHASIIPHLINGSPITDLITNNNDSFDSFLSSYEQYLESPTERYLFEQSVTKYRLTPAEVATILVAGQGLSNKQIGQYLNLEPKTARNHLEIASQKLNAKNRTHLISTSFGLGILPRSLFQNSLEEENIYHLYRLTHSKLKILEIVALGFSNHEISNVYHLEKRTVRNSVSNILNRLESPNRVSAAITFLIAESRGAEPIYLSPRLYQTLILLSRGYTNPQIAESLSVSPKTARNYVSKLLKLFDVSNRTQMATTAIERKIIPLL